MSLSQIEVLRKKAAELQLEAKRLQIAQQAVELQIEEALHAERYPTPSPEREPGMGEGNW